MQLKSYYLISFLSLILFILNIQLIAATKTWNGGTGTGKIWTTAANWSPSGAPVAADDIVFNTAGIITFSTLPASVSYNSLTISQGIVTLATGTAMTLTLGGNAGTDFTISNGAILLLGTNVSITLAANASALISGSFTINFGRTFTSGGALATVTVTGTVTNNGTYNASTTTAVTTISGTLINAGTISNSTAARIGFSSNSTYEHSQNGGTIPTATWNSNSTCLVNRVTSTNPTNMGQTFGNLNWNCTSQSSDANFDGIFTLNGNLILISTGTTGVFRFPSGTTNILGNCTQSGGILRLANTSDRIVNVGGNFSMSGGELRLSVGTAIGTLNIVGNYSHTGGTITETSSGNGLIVFNGSVNQTYTGGGTILNTINYTVNNISGITLLTSVNFPASLTMTQGNISLNGNTLTLGTGNTAALRGTLNWTSGFITGSGSFGRWFSNTAITIGNVQGLFPMGNGTDNRSLWIGGTPTTGGTVTVQHTNLTGTTPISFTENSKNFDKRTNMNWAVATANGLVGTALSLRIQGSGIPGINNVSDLNICLSTGATGGTYSAPGGSLANPQVNRTGLTQTTLANTFYFAATSTSPLPVELSSFTAKILRSGGIKLDWRTETEVNNYGFEIERYHRPLNPLPRGEEKGWVKIGFVEGHGNSNSPKDYSYSDLDATYGNYAYRLKQIDTDGNFDFSKIIEVELGPINEFELSQNYPNPFNPTTTIRFALPESGIVKLTVYNLLGERVVELVNSFKEAGIHTLNFDAGNLNSGVYIYTIDASDFSQTKKMTLIK